MRTDTNVTSSCTPVTSVLAGSATGCRIFGLASMEVLGAAAATGDRRRAEVAPLEGSHVGPTSILTLSPGAFARRQLYHPFDSREQRHRVAYRPGAEPFRSPMREHGMADKSPRQSMSKKSGRSIKDKRIQRKAKADVTAQMERLTRDRKH